MRIKNSAGSFMAPTLGSVTAAASQFPQVSASNFSIVNAPGAQSYPIAGYSWVLLRLHPTDHARAAALQKLFRWLVSDDGQSYAARLNYAPIPSVAQSQALSGLDTLVGANA
jgi:phosphate transport system substrate-binding protein